MTTAEQIRLAWALNSLYPFQPPLADGWTVRDRLFIPQDPGLPVALTLGDDVTGKIARVWRGSETGWDWSADFSFLFCRSPFEVGRTEEGFTAYYDNAKTESGRPLEPADWFAGHSLGGPAATYDGCVGGPAVGLPEILLVATPEPGDAVFSTWASARFLNIHRWENPHDVVPDAPGRFLGYRDLLGPTTVVDFSPIGIDHWDINGNHHAENYIRSFQLQNPIITP